MTFRFFRRWMVTTAVSAVTMPKRICSVACDSSCAVMPPSTLPAAVATSSTIPSRKFIRRLPARPAVTVLDVAITVARLIAAATVIGKPSARFSSGTRNTPPPMPSEAPSPPATAPAAKMMAARSGVTTGMRRSVEVGAARHGGTLPLPAASTISAHRLHTA